jgi:UDP-2-acetamido-2,6-beta-L-arabino-hexul-4-ose reductase
MNILVTGSEGFIAKNLLVHLNRMDGVHAIGLARQAGDLQWKTELAKADIIFHLAGANRPPDAKEFIRDNADLTRFIVDELEITGRNYKLIFSSSVQAALANPYGDSKRAAEDYIKEKVKNGSAVIYRLPGVFGKWSRPNYNSVVSTYCYNSSRGLPLEVRDPDYELSLVYVDDVVKSMIRNLDISPDPGSVIFETVALVYKITLGRLAAIIQSFTDNRNSLFIPKVGDGLEKALYSTWLSYLPDEKFSYPLLKKTDDRGSLFELLKTGGAGQVFISTTLPGITRGNHFHHTKTEKFVVIQGQARIQFRPVNGTNVIGYDVNGNEPTVVDIPPGLIHNITNTGSDILITLFWANEVFDPQNTDTYFEKV